MVGTPTARVWAALVTVYLVWGSTYLAIRVVVQEGVPPLTGMGLRFLVAGLLLGLLLAVRRGWSCLRVTRRQLLATGAVGALLAAGGNGLVAIGEQTVPSGLAALLIASVPLLLVLVRLLRRDVPRPLVWLGVGIGFAGVALLALRGGGIDAVETWGVVIIGCAAVCWTIGSAFAKDWGVPSDALVATTYEMLLGGVVAVVAGLLVGEGGQLDLGSVDASGWVAWAYLVVVGSMLGYTAYSYLLANAPLSLTGTYAYVNPAVAVLLGAVLLDEPITTIVLVGGGLALLGVVLVVSAERGPRQPEDDHGGVVNSHRARRAGLVR